MKGGEVVIKFTILFIALSELILLANRTRSYFAVGGEWLVVVAVIMFYISKLKNTKEEC